MTEVLASILILLSVVVVGTVSGMLTMGTFGMRAALREADLPTRVAASR